MGVGGKDGEVLRRWDVIRVPGCVGELPDSRLHCLRTEFLQDLDVHSEPLRLL